MLEKTGTLVVALRRAFEMSGLSLNQLALRSGAPYHSTHRFFTGKRDDAALATVEKWCRTLDLELRPVRRTPRK
ncbi:MAG: hypothetical protein AABZ47_09550 [Planctomycetota bacterium]